MGSHYNEEAEKVRLASGLFLLIFSRIDNALSWNTFITYLSDMTCGIAALLLCAHFSLGERTHYDVLGIGTRCVSVSAYVTIAFWFSLGGYGVVLWQNPRCDVLYFNLHVRPYCM